MSDPLLLGSVSYTEGGESLGESLNEFPDAPPEEVCTPCLIRSFLRGFSETFGQAFLVGAGIGFLAAVAVGVGLVSAPVLLAGGLILGGVGMGMEAYRFAKNWNNWTGQERAEELGKTVGNLTGGALGGAVGAAAGGAVAGELSAAAPKGYRPKPGERSMTRAEWKAQYRAQRARRNVGKIDQPDVGQTPRGGHMHADHGNQTTISQQEARIQNGTTPSGGNSPTSRATKFDSPEAELEALGRARSKVSGKPKYKADGTPNVEKVVVDDRRGGQPYGSGVERQKYTSGPKAGQSIPAGPSGVKPTQKTGPLPRAEMTMQYNPRTGQWDPITGFPTDKPPTP